MKTSLVPLFFFCILIAGCASRSPSPPSLPRYAMVTGLRPEMEERYRALHANCWPSVQAQITRSNIRNFSIFLTKLEGELFLLGYFEYVGSDYQKDMDAMAADAETQRWWKETDPCQKPLPDAARQKKIWEGMDEVFHEDGDVGSIAPARRVATMTPIEKSRESWYRSSKDRAADAQLRDSIRSAHIRNYSLYLKEIHGQPYLFGYFTYSGPDLSGDLRRARSSPGASRWFEQLHPGLDRLSGAPEHKPGLEEIFHQP